MAEGDASMQAVHGRTTVRPLGRLARTAAVALLAAGLAIGAAPLPVPAAPTAAAAARPPFRDMAGSPAAALVAQAKADGIVAGYPDGTFRPNRPVTRAEAIKMLAAAAGLAPGAYPAGTPVARQVAGERQALLPDAGRHWLARQGWLDAAVGEGFLFPGEYVDARGRPALEPDRPASLAEVAAWAGRLAQGPVDTALQSFLNDPSVPRLLRGGVSSAVAQKLLQGIPNWQARLGRSLTRAEAVAVAEQVRAANRLVPRPGRAPVHFGSTAPGAALQVWSRPGDNVNWAVPARRAVELLKLPHSWDPVTRTLTVSPPGLATATLRAGDPYVRFDDGEALAIGATPPLPGGGDFLVGSYFWIQLLGHWAYDAAHRSYVALPAEYRGVWPPAGGRPALDPRLRQTPQAALAEAAARDPSWAGAQVIRALRADSASAAGQEVDLFVLRRPSDGAAALMVWDGAVPAWSGPSLSAGSVAAPLPAPGSTVLPWTALASGERLTFFVDGIPPYGSMSARPTDPWGREGWLAGLAPGWHVVVAYGRGDPHSPYGLGFVAAWLFRVQAPGTR